MFCALIMVALAVLPTEGLEVVFERLDFLHGYDVYDSTLRVRKYNRTTVTLNGTIVWKVPIDDSFTATTSLYHSSKGNQQFNHYPMKIPTREACKFLYSVYDDYYEHIRDIVNLPEKGECPLQPRVVHIIDKVFPSNVVPPFAPTGLWKAVIMMHVKDVERVRFELTLKAQNDKLF